MVQDGCCADAAADRGCGGWGRSAREWTEARIRHARGPPLGHGVCRSRMALVRDLPRFGVLSSWCCRYGGDLTPPAADFTVAPSPPALRRHRRRHHRVPAPPTPRRRWRPDFFGALMLPGPRCFGTFGAPYHWLLTPLAPRHSDPRRPVHTGAPTLSEPVDVSTPNSTGVPTPPALGHLWPPDAAGTPSLPAPCHHVPGARTPLVPDPSRVLTPRVRGVSETESGMRDLVL